MSAKNTKDKIVTSTAKKVIVKIDEINKILSDDEVRIFNVMIEKMKRFNVA